MEGTTKHPVTYSDVKGSWTIPAAKCSSKENSESAFWVGLGGTQDNAPLEQIATETNCTNGKPSYSAVYEMVPNPAQEIAQTVKAKDLIFAEVQYISKGLFLLELDDPTQGWIFRQVFKGSTSNAARSSAEWIAEAPTKVFGFFKQVQPLTNFGTVNLSGCLEDNTPINKGPIVVQLVMSSNNILLAQPSNVASSNTAFSVTWKHH